MRLGNRIYTLATTLSVTITALQAAPAGAGDMKSADSGTVLLQPQLDSMSARFRQRAPNETIDLYQGAIDDLRGSGILETALNVGDTVPEFALPNAVGDTVPLASLLAKGPLVIVWYRGGWCPYCNMTLQAWKEALPEVKVEGARLVAISPEIPDSSLSTLKRHQLEFEVLSDHGNAVAHQFGIAFRLPDDLVKSYSAHFDLTAYNGDDRYELPLPATFVVGQDRVIRYAFLDADYKRRAEPRDVIEVLKAMAAK